MGRGWALSDLLLTMCQSMFLGKTQHISTAQLRAPILTEAGFTAIVTGVAVWAIWGGDMFPKEGDPTGPPETWSREEMRRWLAAVRTD